ncbi:hypothetical protein BC940DRAFT_365395 [Gongronella butleri]|nr:hypothetical protein BC940DRAFT_365395 [Gongronella butleri]
MFGSTKKRRPSSYINTSDPSTFETFLSMRTPRSINKSRRTSMVTDVLVDNVVSTQRRRSSMMQLLAHGMLDDMIHPTAHAPMAMAMDIDQDDNDNDNHVPAYEQLQIPDLYTFNSTTASLSSSSTITTASSSLSTNSSMSSSNPQRLQRSNSISSIITTTLATKFNPAPPLSPSSLSSQAPAPANSLDPAQKVRRRHSSGDIMDSPHRLALAAHDMCLQDIQQHGLPCMLASKVPLCYFLLHLLQEYSCENLFFYMELEQLEAACVSEAQQWATAQHLYETYVSKSSFFEVNLDDTVRGEIIQALDAKLLSGCFDKAKRAVYLLLEYSFMQFMHTSTWQTMLTSCGLTTVRYDATAKQKAVDALVQHLDRAQAMIDAGAGAALNPSIKHRHDLVKVMVHAFCHTRVGVNADAFDRSAAHSTPLDVLKHPLTIETPGAYMSPKPATIATPTRQKRGLKLALDLFAGRKKRPDHHA